MPIEHKAENERGPEVVGGNLRGYLDLIRQ